MPSTQCVVNVNVGQILILKAHLSIWCLLSSQTLFCLDSLRLLERICPCANSTILNILPKLLGSKKPYLMILLHDGSQRNTELLSENTINVLRYSRLEHPISWAHRNRSGQKRAWRLWSRSPCSLQKAARKKTPEPLWSPIHRERCEGTVLKNSGLSLPPPALLARAAALVTD